ncbi:glutathione S-transferase family protein [Paracoccaceae bacterium Fryx2]|nr:glutathione S-transferase family protein [Paracoccaceae bacterium Fryx2]
MTELTLYTNPQSRGAIARWMLEEVGQPYTAVPLAYGPEMHSPAYLALNPMAKVPTLTHGGHVVTECAAICAYLADAFPEAGLAPANRAACYRWLFFGAGPLEAAVTNRALGIEIPAEKRGFVGYGHFDLVIATLEGALARSPYIAGDSFSAADVYVGAQIGFAMQYNGIPAKPAFTAYWDRIKDRPARARAAAADAALMAQA